MSWLFGRKKHQKDSPPPEEEPSDLNEEYVVINPRPSQPPMAPDPSLYPTGNLYPYIPSVPAANSSKDQGQGDAIPYLSDVPFKLCKQLQSATSNDLEIDRLRIDEILYFIERIENQNYDYSFSLEESVIAEMNSGNNE